MPDGQRVLGGRYLLKDKVGNGGMASVYRAQDQVLDRTVAVKIMLPQYAGDATFAARFKQEAQAAAGLQSPYIVGVYDWGKDGDTYYIVMEYLRGTDLKSGVRSHGALDPKKVAQIGSQICGALSVAHKHEIIHRDIKPQNIMVLPDGNIKVMDFGIARAKNSHLTQDNNVLGTAHYVSPEQTRGQDLGATSDIYSLGVVMYECATGRVPFDGDDAISVALKQVNELPIPPSQVNPGVDPALERIILKCMEKDPANRFQTADELRQVLNAYAAGRAVDVAEPTRVIAAPMGVGGAETRVMSDATQAMVRPAGTAGPGSTAAGPRVAASASSRGQNSYDEPKKGNGAKIAAIVIGAIVVIAAAVFFASNLFGGSGEMVIVPNVIDYTQEEAEDALENAGFNVEYGKAVNDDEVEEGRVVDQTPDGNKEAPEGSTVTLTLSKGPVPVKETEVPNITGKTADEAEALLTAANLKGQAHEESNEAEAGTVFKQGKNTGEVVEEGTVIEYWVSTGPDTIDVPNLTGKTKEQAIEALGDKLSYTFSSDYSATVPAGSVISYEPGGSVKPGTTIKIVLSQGPEPVAKVNAPNFVNDSASHAKPQLESLGFKVVVNGPADGIIVSQSASGSLDKGTTITLTTQARTDANTED
ncbi:Stk1 family PASTA domain-containing Ser/Thr kinase [Collinsella intestinalis]|uniref:non-specific serine/threonine protein kinase n=1 Tax=Collinsella intestinalis TaxID=147207 RepID=A0A414NEK1_9ACTN|nr:Stk1 family PASTA domain-containing Ser/Thr kinase [Collinsella intestinalis]RHF38250.1 Stk1 family PASTA domain-containing Ser/Thr kinase [Collinsella intestinalis]